MFWDLQSTGSYRDQEICKVSVTYNTMCQPELGACKVSLSLPGRLFLSDLIGWEMDR